MINPNPFNVLLEMEKYDLINALLYKNKNVYEKTQPYLKEPVKNLFDKISPDGLVGIHGKRL